MQRTPRIDLANRDLFSVARAVAQRVRAWARWSLLAIALIAWLKAWSPDGAVAAAPYRYAEDARGRPARVTESWEIQGTEFQGIGTINALVRCGDEIFLADSQSRVRRYDVKQRKPLDEIS